MLAARAAMRRDTLEPARVVEKLSFPATCAVLGLAIKWLRDRVEQAEADTISLRERAQQIESLAEPIHRHHDILSGLKRAGLWRTYFNDTVAGQALNEQARQLEIATQRLRPYLTSPDPVADLQRHLQVRLAPVEITVSGEQPLLDANRAADKLLQRALSYTGLIAVADEVAESLLSAHPRSLRGSWPLKRVHLHIEFDPPDSMILSIRPIAAAARDGDVADAKRQHALGAIGGELLTYGDGVQASKVPLHVLARSM